MKRCKILLTVIAMCLFCTVVSCTGGNTNHEHSYTEWIITQAPTLEAEGEAYRYCNCTDKQEIIVPNLLDAEVWTVSEHVDSTCAIHGTDTYTSIYGEVVVELEFAAHEYGEWTIDVNPSFTEGGSASRICVYGETDVVEIPNVLDEEVWTCDEYIESTCTVNGSATYSSVYGVVTLELELAAHEYGAWVLDQEPTLTEMGKAHHECHCTFVEEVDVPVLSDDVWTEESEVLPTYNEAGTKTFVSEYGKVVFTVAKKVAPYDGKTYSAFAFDAAGANNEFEYRPVSCETAWNKTTVTLDAAGTGIGTGFPFRGIVSIKMINEETGEIEITIVGIEYDQDNNPVLDENGDVIIREDSTSVSRGFVDFETGIIVKPFNTSYNDVLVFTPFEVGVTGETAKASAWNNTIAIDYEFEGETHSMMVYNNRVYFGLSFVDAEGNSIAAEEAYNSAYVYVNNAEGRVIGFVNNGENQVVVDGHEGVFTGELGEIVVSGYGVVTVNGVSGTYVALPDAGEHTLGVYADGAYYEIAFAEDAYTAVKPMVTISYNTGEYAVVEAESVNKNINHVLPVPTSETMFFEGWFYDEECLNPVGAEFIPTVDVELHAAWSIKIFVNIEGVLEGDAEVVILGVGDEIGKYLPTYGLEVEAGLIFKGWYLDATFENALPEAAEVSEEDNNITIYAKWDELPAYYGSYKGTEIWNAGYGNNSSYNVTIDENGNISGKFTGVVTSYDPENQLIKWTKSNSSTTYSMWYDDVTGLLVVDYYSNNYTSNDLYIFGKYQQTNKFAATYAVKCNLNPSSTSVGWYAHFINVMTANGPKEVFIYNSRIYTDFVATTTTGTPVTAASVKNEKDVVVRDAQTNEIILAVSSLGTSFTNNTNTVTLDKYFGTYTNGAEQIVLDGTGNITTSDGKAGTYEAVENAEYGFDVYFNDNTEYYQLTLSGENYTMIYPTVEISFEVGAAHTPIASQVYNINVPATLPNGDDEGYVFNGWFLDEEFTNPVPATFKPTAPITIYAKYSAPAVLTVVYNNGEANGEFVYSQGDIATMEMPIFAKHAFVGWFTTSNFEEGSEWTNGVAIVEDATIYAKWEVAPVYNNTYVPTEVEYKSNVENGTASIYTWTSAKVDINPYGTGSCTAYPFRGDITISDYNAETAELLFHVGASVYRGYIEAESGIIVLNNEYGVDADIKSVFVVSPFETASLASVIKSSYWDDGATMCIVYPYEGIDYTIFVYENVVYFNVEFVDGEGNAVQAANCHNTSVLYVNDSEGNLIGKFGYDGTTMQFLDGYEGTYTNGEESMTLDGVKNIVLDGSAGTYAKATEGAAYTFDVYVNGCYYELTVDKAAMTYSYVQPFVDITFEAGEYASIAAQHVNKNIVIALPTPEHESVVFRGWYADAEYNQIVDAEYIPVESCTLYAKWDEKMIVTVVYGNGIEDAVFYYGTGDTPILTQPSYTNGMVFAGWYSDSALTTPYEAAALTESITVYVAWIEASPFYGTWAGANVYGSSSSGGKSSGGYTKSLTIDLNGVASGTKSGTITDYDPSTGTFKLGSSYGHFDEANGVMVVNYGSKSDGLSNDIYVFVKNATSASCSGTSSYWNSGLTRICEFTLNDGSTKLVFVHQNKVYGSVTFTSSTANVTAANAYQAADLTVYDSKGQVIATFVKSGSCLA